MSSVNEKVLVPVAPGGGGGVGASARALPAAVSTDGKKAQDKRESHSPPAWWRMAAATFWNPIVPQSWEVDFHVSNLEVERQSEFSRDPQPDEQEPTALIFKECSKVIRELRDAQTESNLEKAQRRILELHTDSSGGHKPIFCTRGAVGETLLHLFALQAARPVFLAAGSGAPPCCFSLPRASL